mgnify:CR=1 FL=1
MARLEPVPKAEWNDDARAAIRAAMPAVASDRFLSDDPDAPLLTNGIASLLHHPRLAAAFLGFNGQLLWEPVLDPRVRELVVLRVARHTRSSYEWVQHAKLSQRYGVSSAEIEAVASGDDSGWAPSDATILEATDQLLTNYQIDDDTWDQLANVMDERTLLELIFVVGTYTALAMVFNGIDIELDPDLDPAGAPSITSE